MQPSVDKEQVKAVNSKLRGLFLTWLLRGIPVL